MPPKPSLPDSVQNFFARHQLVGGHGLVAVSGGPDSVALAHLLITLVRAGLISSLTLAHFNHGWRGPESDADELFVQNLASSWRSSVPSVTCRTIRSNETTKSENAARHERYEWLAQMAREIQADWVAVGHSAEDQVETVLFRLLRGSGLQGLAGMPALRPLAPGIQLLRPLLDIRRADLLGYLQEQGQPYRLDSSNQDLNFSRNRIRQELIPLLEKGYQPALMEIFLRLGQQCQEVNDWIQQEALNLLTQTELPRAGKQVILGVNRLASANRHLLREMVRQIWSREGWPQNAMTFHHWNRFPSLILGEVFACDFPDGLYAQRAGPVLQIGPKNPGFAPA